MPAPLLELDGIAFRYKTRTALAGVSLRLPAGRFIGLLGPNGSGKSTLVRLAAGLLRPAAGTVRLDGRDLASLHRTDIARRIAVVPQVAPMPSAFTGGEIVLMGRTPHLGWLSAEGAEDREIARQALALVDGHELANRRVGELSGGERQRLILARALAQEPDVLLLDEPVASLDVAHQVAVLNVVRSLVRTGELAALGVFHDVNLAVEYCDELAFLVEGRLVAQGALELLLTTEHLQRVYGLCLPIIRHPDSDRPAVLYPALERASVEAIHGLLDAQGGPEWDG